MKRFVYSFGAVLIGAAATMGCTTDTNGSGGNGGTGNTGQGPGPGGGGQGPGGQGPGGQGPGGQGAGGMLPTAQVDFEEAAFTTNEAPDGAVDVTIALTLPVGEALDADLTIALEADAASTATVGDDVVDTGALEVTFPAGAESGATQTLTITPVADVAREGNEDLVLSFTGTNAMLGSDATVTITDDDALMIGHTRDFGGGDWVNMNVDVHDPGTDLTDVGSLTVGLVDIEGAAYDSVNDVTYVVSDGLQELLAMVDSAGVTTVIGPVGFSRVRCLAFDPGTGTLYGVDDGTDALITIDTTTGRGTAVGPAMSFTSVKACAYDSTANILYGVDDGTDRLISIDTGTGAAAAIMSGLGTSNIEGLAYDPNADVLFGLDTSGDALVTIDRTAGTFTLVNNVDDTTTVIAALAYDATSNLLIGADNDAESIVEIADDTAEVNHIAVVGALGVDGLAFDPTANILYGSSTSNTATLVSYNRTTGALVSEVVLADPDADVIALAHDGTTLFGYDANSGLMVSLDPTTGAITVLGNPNTGGDDITGLAYGGGVLYGSTLTELFTIDTSSGSATLVGGYTIATDVEGLAYNAGKLFAVETYFGDQFMYEIDPADGSDTDIGIQLGSRGVYGLAHDGTSLFGLDDDRGALVTLSETDGTVTLINSRAVLADGMAYNSNTSTVYISELDIPWLWAHDLATNNTTLVGPIYDAGFDTFLLAPGLAYDPTSSTLFASDEFGELISIDTTDGTVTYIANFDLSGEIEGLAWDDANATLYAASPTTLYAVDVVSGAQTSVGVFTTHDDMRGLGWDPITSTLYGVDQGLDVDDIVAAVTIDTTTGMSTTLRALARGNCDGAESQCSVARGLTFAAP